MKDLFIHLRTRTSYSLLEGALRIEKLGSLCHENYQPALAITDNNNMFGALEFSETLAKNGIQPLIGCTLNVENNGTLVFLAKTHNGYNNLIKLASLANKRVRTHITQNEIVEYQLGLICLSGGPDGILNKMLIDNRISEARSQLENLASIFSDRLYLELQRFGNKDEKNTEAWLVDCAKKFGLGIVATNDVYFSQREDFESNDVLLCIAQGVKVSDSQRRKITTEQYFKSTAEMVELFKDLPEAIAATAEISKRCSFFPQEQEASLPRFETEDGEGEDSLLRKLSMLGLEERLAQLEKNKEIIGEQDDYRKRLEKELNMIIEMGFAGYFLIVADFVQWALSKKIPVGPGRGSGAGSLVAFALKITDLDPLRFGLIFERFLNPERVSMPDFDIDFCQNRRDEVVRYVREHYGEDRVANIITFGKLQARAVLRDVGRVLGMPYGQIDRLAKLVPNNPAHPVTLSEAIESEPALQAARDEDEQVAKLLDISLRLEGLNRHASTHAAGVVIGNRPLDQIIPIAQDQNGATITQFSMKWVEKAGLVKFDFLGLKTLTALRLTCDLLAQRGVEVDLSTLPLDDKKTYELFARAETGGIFQMESGGIRDVLRKTNPNRIEDLIALTALYRPGPMDNIPQYISRKKGETKPDYLHPLLEPVLKETFGVIIYQEQVMQIARVLAGYSDAKADLLRRAMGKKIKKEMDAQRHHFAKGAENKGVDVKTARHIFDLVARFAGYGFNKSHAAAYALLAYQTGWLKTHYPVEFLAALMTLDIHNPEKISQFKQEAQKLNIKVNPPDINSSEALFSVKDNEILHALAAVRDVGVEAAKNFVKVREEKNGFKDVFDFVGSCSNFNATNENGASASGAINKRALESLAGAGAFDSIHLNRRQLMEHSTILVGSGKQMLDSKNQNSLFGADEELAKTILPACEDWNMQERLALEFKAAGMYLSSHPLEPWAEKFSQFGIIQYAELEKNNRSTGRVCGVITVIQQRRSRKNKPFAFVRLSDLTGNFEVVIFSELLAKARDFLEVGELVVADVEIDRQNESVRMRANSLKRLNDNLAAPARKQMQVRLFISKLDILPQIKQKLEASPGGTKVHLIIDEGTEIALPGSFAMNKDMVKDFEAMVGVSRVE